MILLLHQPLAKYLVGRVSMDALNVLVDVLKKSIFNLKAVTQKHFIGIALLTYTHINNNR